MPPPVILNPEELDLTTSIATREEIEKINPQRFEMQHVDAICLLNPEEHLIVGYKDVRPDEFWVRGHFPDFPLMPGVLMCEAAAQLASYYTHTQGILKEGIIGFGGMEEVRFRGPVRPGDRLVLVGKGKRLRKLQTIFAVQGFVGTAMVFHGDIIGVPLVPEEK
ncbi:MAG: 3-hydroxyacyl-ACP dehydratase FabZ family protein [Gemmataceae bacterium]